MGTTAFPRESQGLSPRRTVRERELRSCGPNPGMLGREGPGQGRHSGFRPRALQQLRGLLGLPSPPGRFVVLIPPPSRLPPPARRVLRRSGPGRSLLQGGETPLCPQLVPQDFSLEAGRKGLTAPLPPPAPSAPREGRRFPPEVSLGKPSPLFSTFPQSSAFK